MFFNPRRLKLQKLSTPSRIAQTAVGDRETLPHPCNGFYSSYGRCEFGLHVERTIEVREPST